MVEINAYSKAKDGGKKLSTNFAVKEFACKDGSDAVLVPADGPCPIVRGLVNLSVCLQVAGGLLVP